VDGSGNVYIADTQDDAIKEIPFAFVGPASLTESPPAGSDSLLQVLPATTNLTGVFAPTSDQGWLTIGAIASGVVSFSFTANASPSARVAHITVLGQQITVTQNGSAQTITFGPLSNQVLGTAPFTISATASSDLPVSFSSQTTSVCTVSGASVTLVSAGTCTIQATQGGNSSYSPAPSVSQSFLVQLAQIITFPTLSNQALGATPFTVSATASSGLAVSFASTTASACTVSGATVTLVALGTCSIQATQAGNATYTAATPVNQSFQVQAPVATLGSSSLGFTNTLVGRASAIQTVTLQNTGNVALTIASIRPTGTDAANYQYTVDATLPCPISPATLSAGASCTLDVAFAPLSAGAHNNAQITITDNSGNVVGATQTVGLTGTGIVLSSIAVTAASTSIANYTTEQFTATGTYSDNSTANLTNLVTWSSSSTNAATINATGLVTALAIGPTNITATLGTVTSNTFQLTIGSGLQFYPLTPCRVADTRTSAGFTGPQGPPYLAGGTSRSFPVVGFCGVPANATAYSLNVTVVPRTGELGFLTTWPTGQPQPLASTLNSPVGEVVANAALVPAGTNGDISIYASDDTDVLFDVNGYFAPPGTSELQFYPLTPCRVADTRQGAGFTGTQGPPSLSGGTSRNFAVAGLCGVPATAAAYSLNVTVVPTGGVLNYLTTWPTGQAKPLASTLNSPGGQVVANAALVPAGTNGDIGIYVSDATDVLFDINGYFAAPGASGLDFYAMTPCRVADTRGYGGFTGQFGPPSMGAATSRSFAVPLSVCSVPTTAAAYSLNVTVVPTNGVLNYLTTWPTGQAKPWASTLNSPDGLVVANAALVPAGTGGAISIYVSDPTDVLFDINGYFAPEQ
jgi:hypothetical protein